MTIVEAINELMARPDRVAVLDPDVIVSVANNGMLIDETKEHKAYPRFRARHLTAVLWVTMTRDQLIERAEYAARQLEQQRAANGH